MNSPPAFSPGNMHYLFRENGGTITTNWFGLCETGKLGIAASLAETARAIVTAARLGNPITYKDFTIGEVGVSHPENYRLLTPAEIVLMRQAVADLDAGVAQRIFGGPGRNPER